MLNFCDIFKPSDDCSVKKCTISKKGSRRKKRLRAAKKMERQNKKINRIAKG